MSGHFLERLERTGSIWNTEFADEMAAQEQAILNANEMLTKIEGYKKKAEDRLAFLAAEVV